MSSNIYEGSFAKQNVYYSQVMKTRGIHGAGYLIEESEFVFFLPPHQITCIYTEWGEENTITTHKSGLNCKS